MSHTYEYRKQAKSTASEKSTASVRPSVNLLRSNTFQPTYEQLGHQVDRANGMPTAALSAASAASEAGPIQAAGKEERYTKQAEEYRGKEIEAYDQYIRTTGDPDQKAIWKQEYEKNRELKAGRMRKLGKSDDEIKSDNAQTTDALSQMQRARDRNIGTQLPDSAQDADPNDKVQRYTGYLSDLHIILDNMSDEELRKRTDVQKGMVDAYSGAHRAGLGTDGSKGAFIPGMKRDLMRSLYFRLMDVNGDKDLYNMFRTKDQNKAINDVSARMQSSGVSELLKRQHESTFESTDDFSDETTASRADTMRGFWSTVIVPSVADARTAVGTSTGINDTLQNNISDQAVVDRHRNEKIDPTGKPLGAEIGADFLMQITGPNPAFPIEGRPKPGDSKKPELKIEPVPQTLELTASEEKELDKIEKKEAKKKNKAEKKAQREKEKAEKKAQREKEKAEKRAFEQEVARQKAIREQEEAQHREEMKEVEAELEARRKHQKSEERLQKTLEKEKRKKKKEEEKKEKKKGRRKGFFGRLFGRNKRTLEEEQDMIDGL